MPKRFEDPIEVPRIVLGGLEAVRASGRTNMLDYRRVQEAAALLGYRATVVWVEEHRREYSEGVFRGFAAAE